ncbi:probable E3 ubiquitin ligase complex SCF subunit sconB isoform X1 [Mizuhopecten yessoensis]|uniref:probable E3 ubiquitin ligase complex SCF subunit sconB isoform X1 n=1 Tax=Mizuhopecten yessoensis TaxID=6573 RepID=UPI000B459B95|nr:probable E3 ubiquitin ligase complex SCF subunit sconB isoform X1 [Mizuhopecten yessoensis]
MNAVAERPPIVAAAGRKGHLSPQRDGKTGRRRPEGEEDDRRLLDWRGHGGRHPTQSSVEFDRQLDKVSMWMENWSHSQRCQLMENLLRRSGHNQFQFLYTVMQPNVHRDFIYNAKSHFPGMDFKSVSTPAMREAQKRDREKQNEKRRRLKLYRQDNYFREKSAHLKDDSQVSYLAEEHNEMGLKLPQIPSGVKTNTDKGTDLSVINFKSKHKKKGASFPKIITSNTLPKNHKNKLKPAVSVINSEDMSAVNSSAPVLRFIDMPIRRHIQDEGNMRYLGSSLSSLPVSTRYTLESSVSFIYDDQNQPQKKKTKNLLDEEAWSVIHWYLDEWSDVRRNEFLHKFLLKLDPRQHYFISSFLSMRQYRDFLTMLPEHISLKILDYMTPEKILKCSLVSKAWYALANSNKLWGWKCEEVQLLVPIPTNPCWKHIYRDNMHLKMNWNSGNCRTLDLKGHSDIVEAVTFNHRLFASGSQDKTIRIWDIKTGRPLQVLKGHEKGVWCLNFFTETLLVSGSYDGTIKVWNLRTGSTVRTMLAHDGPVWAMVRHNNILVTASQDKTAKIWNISRCYLIHNLYGHTEAVFAVDLSEDGTLTITGSADRTLRIWDTATGVQKKLIWVSQSTSIMAVSYSKGYVACSYGETICLYRLERPKLIKTYEEHEKRIETLELQMKDTKEVTGTIISAGQDGMVKYWDVQKNTSIRTFKGHVGSVKSIRFDELRIATGAKDKIRIWDFTYQEKIDTKKRNVDDESLISKSPSKDVHGASAGSNQGKEFPGTPSKPLKIKVLHGTPANSQREKEVKSSSSPRGKDVLRPSGKSKGAKETPESPTRTLQVKDGKDIHRTSGDPEESKETTEAPTTILRVREILPEVIVTESR